MPAWTEKDDADLRLIAGDYTAKDLARLFNRTPGAVRTRCNELGIAYKEDPKKGQPWTQGDLLELHKLLQDYTFADAARKIGRTAEAVKKKARSLGWGPGARTAGGDVVKPWTEEEDSLLFELIEGHSFRYIANRLGRTPNAVSLRASRIGAHKTKHRWSLRKLARLFGVSDQTISSWRKKLHRKYRYRDTLKEPTSEEVQELAKAMLESSISGARVQVLRRVAEGDWDFEEVLD